MARRKTDHQPGKQARRTKNSRKNEVLLKKVPDIIIACEDKDSSPTYFRQIVQTLIDERKITQDSFVIATHQHTHCEGVLDDLMTHKTDGKTFRDFEHKWIVIDRDQALQVGQGHSAEDFVNAVAKAKKNKVEVAYANDSFELWYLMHFETVTSYFTRQELVVRVIDHLKRLDPTRYACLDKNTIKSQTMTQLIFNDLSPLQSEAIKRAVRLEQSNQGQDPTVTNPATRIHRLVCLLRTLHLSKPLCQDIVPCDAVIECCESAT
jgi:hypothetical protein